VKNTYFSKIFQNDEKCIDFFKVVKNTKKFQSGLVVMGNLPRWKIIKSMTNTKISQNGLIVMGYRPK